MFARLRDLCTFDGHRWLTVGDIGWRDWHRLLCHCAAARYFWAAWTAPSTLLRAGLGGCPYIIRYCICRCQVGGGGAGDFGAGGLAGGFGAGGLFDFEVGDGGVIGDLRDHGTGVGKLDAADVAHGGVEGAEDKFGALEFDAATQQGVDDLDEGGLDGFFVLEEGGVMDAGRGRSLDGAEHALVEVAELLSAESGGAATDSGDFDVGTVFRIWHIGPVGAVEICRIEIRSGILPGHFLSDRFLSERVLLNPFVGALDNFFVVTS